MGIQGFPFSGMSPLMGPSLSPSSLPMANGGGMPAHAANPFGVQSPMFPGASQTQNNIMPGVGGGGDMASMMTGLMGMMAGLMGMIATLLMGIMSGSINGTAAPGTGGSATPGTDAVNTPGTNGATGPGGSSGGSSISSGSPAGDSTQSMRAFAQTAEANARGMNQAGWCLKGVRIALEKAGIVIPRKPSAYMSVETFRGMPDKFEEVQVGSADELKRLGPGYIVVYERGGSGAMAEHGHIYVTLGNGKEASSLVRDMFSPPNGFKVFKIKE